MAFSRFLFSQDGNTGVAFASTTEASMVAFAPAAFLVFCENNTKAKGFNPEDRKFPMAMTFYDGKQVVCTSAAADGCTDESGNVTWSTDSGCAKKKTGKAGVLESDWEPCGDTSLDECCNSGVSWVRSKTTDATEAFGIGMYTVSKSQSVLGNAMTPFDAEVIMDARPQLLKDLITCPNNGPVRVGLVGMILSAGVSFTAAAVAIDTPATGYVGAATTVTSASIPVAGGDAQVDFKTKVNYHKNADNSDSEREVRNKYMGYSAFLQTFGEDATSADSDEAAIKTATGAMNVGILVAAIDNLDASTMAAEDLISWDPKLSQTKQKKDVAEGSVPQSRYDSSLFSICFCVKDQPLTSLLLAFYYFVITDSCTFFSLPVMI